MLPFHQPKKVSAGVMGTVSAPKEEEEEHLDPHMYVACNELLQAIDNRDVTQMAFWFKRIHELTDMEEHVEGPHIGEY